MAHLSLQASKGPQESAEKDHRYCMHQSMWLLRHRWSLLLFSLGVVDVVDSGCGGPQQLMVSPGEFTSGNFPSNYDNGKSCSWKITVEANKVKKKVAIVTSWPFWGLMYTWDSLQRGHGTVFIFIMVVLLLLSSHISENFNKILRSLFFLFILLNNAEGYPCANYQIKHESI